MEPRRSGRATKPSAKLLEAKEKVELVEVRVIQRLKVPIPETEESHIYSEPAISDQEEEIMEESISYLDSAARKSAKAKELKQLRKLDFQSFMALIPDKTSIEFDPLDCGAHREPEPRLPYGINPESLYDLFSLY